MKHKIPTNVRLPANFRFIVGAISFIAVLLLVSSCVTRVYQNQNQNITNTPAITTTPANTATTPAKGRVVMAITDASVKMGSVTSLKMTVNDVSLHSDANGWVTVATPQRTYDLMALKASGNQVLLADLSLLPARYDQMRLEVSSVSVTDINGTHDAKMPSGTLRLNGEVVILADKTATVSFDFIADQSLYTTTDGKYVFAPFIVMESRTDANADATASDNVRLTGGTLQSSTRVSMDSVGNLVVGGTLPPYLTINPDGTISGTQNPLNTNSTNNNAANNPGTNSTHSAKAVDITIQDLAFNPSTITINKGDTVVWTNRDGMNHSVISDTGTELKSSLLSTGTSYFHKFNAIGSFAYHCGVHSSMKATVVVQ